jgi:hypothetical protein
MVIDKSRAMGLHQNQPSATIDEVQDSDEVFLFHGIVVVR